MQVLIQDSITLNPKLLMAVSKEWRTGCIYNYMWHVASTLFAELKAGVTDSSEMWIVVYEVLGLGFSEVRGDH